MWTVIAPPQTGWPANNRNVFPIVLKAWDSSIKVSADYVSAEAPLLGWCLPFHCVLTWWKGIHVQALWGHFYKGISPFLRAPPSYPNHLPKGLPPNTITLRLSFEQMNLVSEWVSEWVIEAAQLCPTLCDPMDCSPPGSSVHGILQARILEWVTIPFSRGSSQPRNRTQVSCIGGRRCNLWATREDEFKGATTLQSIAISLISEVCIIGNLRNLWIWLFKFIFFFLVKIVFGIIRSKFLISLL